MNNKKSTIQIVCLLMAFVMSLFVIGCDLVNNALSSGNSNGLPREGSINPERCDTTSIIVDTSNGVCDTCNIEVITPTTTLTIEKTNNTIQGQYETISIDFDDTFGPINGIHGFDVLVTYDPSALSLNVVSPGQMILDCGWEYFTYRAGSNGNCASSPCPSGTIRIVSIASYHNNPICNASTGKAQLAELTFLVTNERIYECTFLPISFIWYDCGDNSFVSVTGDSLFISRNLFNYANEIPISGDSLFPSLYGANLTCDTLVGYVDLHRVIDFYNGGIDIVCADSIDARGDINLNEIAYEIADAVLYSNYFIYGLGVFDVSTELQINASDINADGTPLTVADLVYLVRVVIGAALPYPKSVDTVQGIYTHTNEGVISVLGELEIGAMYVVVAGEATPEFRSTEMDMIYNFDGTNTKILVYSLEGNSLTGVILKVSGDLVSIEMADYLGNPVDATFLPLENRLFQNCPNPFELSTTITFSLPKTSDYVIEIFKKSNNVRVAKYEDTSDAGFTSIDIDGTDWLKDIYIYTLEVDGVLIDTKAMELSF